MRRKADDQKENDWNVNNRTEKEPPEKMCIRDRAVSDHHSGAQHCGAEAGGKTDGAFSGCDAAVYDCRAYEIQDFSMPASVKLWYPFLFPSRW